MNGKLVVCGHCQQSFESFENTTICTKCVGKHLPGVMAKMQAPQRWKETPPPPPRVVWEGKCWADGQECSSRAVLSWREDGKTEVLFEYSRDKDAMKVSIWKRLGSTPDQFVMDAAAMMSTASTPNRTGTPQT